MAQFRDANLNLIDTLGQSQPSAPALVTPQAKSVPASTATSTVAASDVKYNDLTTGNLVADRS